MQTFESDRDLEAEITANIENLEQFYGLSSVNSLQQLVQIILDPKKSEMLFRQRNVTMASIFSEKRDPTEINLQHAKLFAEKYSYEKLAEKFPKPKGETNRMLISILQHKLAKQTISSHQTRKTIWLLASGARFNMFHHKGLYQELLAYQSYPDYFIRSIKQDINRTVARSQTSEQELQSLSNVLIAFSRRNPFVGYCQGLNFVANFLLTMQFTEEEAFWILSEIIETVIPMDYYTNMIGVVCDQQVFLAILAKLHPQITKKFDEVGLDPSVLSIQWFVCLFTSSLPFYVEYVISQLVKVVWDRLLVEGPRAFIKTGLIILSYFKQQILKVNQFHQIIMLLEKGTKQLTLPEQEFNLLFEKIFISREGLVLARTLYREYHLKDKLSDRLVGKKPVLDEIVCNPKWPICTVALEHNRRNREEVEIWIFRQGQPPNIDPQYLIKQIDNKHKNQTKGNKGYLQGQSLKKSPPIFINPNFQDFAKLRPIKEERQSYLQSQYDQKFRGDSVFCKEKNAYSDLTIGRMQHVCQHHISLKMHEEGRLSKARKSLIIVEHEQNSTLKNENLKKLMQMNQVNEGGEGDEQQMVQRSQTINFFSKFLNDNMQLSNIIIPSSKAH